MGSTKNSINCPTCDTEIDVQDMLSQQLEEEIRSKYMKQFAEERKSVEAKEQTLREQQLKFEEAKKRENESFKKRLEQKLSEEKEALQVSLRKKIETESEASFKEMQQELAQKSEQIKELHKSKAEIERLKREKSELQEAARAEAQKEMNKMLEDERVKLKRAEEEKMELRLKELHKQLEDQKKLTEEMKRKQEQGSMQMQGEVQELAIEEYLMHQFPLDTIEEIKKGARGGDCLQVVNTRTAQNCGKIYYESKRTKEFQPAWIEKFKTDIREKGADIGVLITEAMPSDMDRMGFRDGIFICSFQEFKGLSVVLRQQVLQVHGAVATQENKGDKMHMLYDYLTSNTFRMQIEAIVEGFTQMQEELDKEKRSMQLIWKRREKQIEKVITNTIDMYGSVKGIAGNAIQSVKSLELPEENEELENEA